jgi:hypothetical protein
MKNITVVLFALSTLVALLFFYNVFNLDSPTNGFCTIWMLFFLYYRIMFFMFGIGIVICWRLLVEKELDRILLFWLWVIILINISFSSYRYYSSRPNFKCPEMFIHIEND